ncbi:hypothetical protein EVAR_63857_1 [Eumeta japonica]|uniref:Uncharacterized protein n=1 Tax=Eumeta variegata TaxID=151549 RepID=A0A4C1SCD3_EUMVA|nr:hypothetical protein EVAR_63857_1 [Eumeta japonica]
MRGIEVISSSRPTLRNNSSILYNFICDSFGIFTVTLKQLQNVYDVLRGLNHIQSYGLECVDNRFQQSRVFIYQIIIKPQQMNRAVYVLRPNAPHITRSFRLKSKQMTRHFFLAYAVSYAKPFAKALNVNGVVIPVEVLRAGSLAECRYVSNKARRVRMLQFTIKIYQF